MELTAAAQARLYAHWVDLTALKARLTPGTIAHTNVSERCMQAWADLRR